MANQDTSFLASCAECYDTKADVLLRQKSDPSLPPLISRYLIPTCFPFTSKSINETQVVCHDFRKRYCFVFSLVDVDQKLSVVFTFFARRMWLKIELNGIY